MQVAVQQPLKRERKERYLIKYTWLHLPNSAYLNSLLSIDSMLRFYTYWLFLDPIIFDTAHDCNFMLIRSSAETFDDRPKVEKLALRKKGIGSEARAERMAKADADLQLLGEAEQQRQLQKQKKRRLQGREDEVCYSFFFLSFLYFILSFAFMVWVAKHMLGSKKRNKQWEYVLALSVNLRNMHISFVKENKLELYRKIGERIGNLRKCKLY